MNKKILIALGISLAINFVFIGFETAKAIYRPAFSHIPAERPGFVPGGRGHQSLTFKEKTMMRDLFHNAVKDHEKEMKEAKKQVEDALKAEPFNAENFKTAMARGSAVRATIDTAVQANMIEIVSKMTPQERSDFADSFAQRGMHGRSMKKEEFGKDEMRHERSDFRRYKRRMRPCECAGTEAARSETKPCFCRKGKNANRRGSEKMSERPDNNREHTKSQSRRERSAKRIRPQQQSAQQQVPMMPLSPASVPAGQ